MSKKTRREEVRLIRALKGQGATDGLIGARAERNLRRTHFALRFGDLRTDDNSTLARKEGVREAFNSPFWPFVLTTTSVGQEGMVFGQNRQEDLVAHLLDHLSVEEIAVLAEKMQISLEPSEMVAEP